MFKLFTNIAALLIVTGVILFVLSFNVNVSMWYGIEITKSGVFIFIIGLFMQIMENEVEKRKLKKI